MTRRAAVALGLLALAAVPRVSGAGAAAAPEAAALRAPRAFASIADRSERSRALFAEASRVLLHPRCANCHPADDRPRQGDAPVVHDPPVFRGTADRGVPAMQCSSCHQDRNLEHARVPGAPGWHLAPASMAWLGKTPGHVCRQLQDPKRNGGKTLEQIWHHSAHDALVGWGWKPGPGRAPAPGTQKEFGDLVRAWIDTGAACPPEEASR
jgi:hypothetical protein